MSRLHQWWQQWRRDPLVELGFEVSLRSPWLWTYRTKAPTYHAVHIHTLGMVDLWRWHIEFYLGHGTRDVKRVHRTRSQAIAHFTAWKLTGEP